MNYNDSITKTLEGTSKIKKCIESCHTVEQFNCMQNMLNGLCSMCNMWSVQLNRKDRIKYNYFAKIAVDEVVELGKTWTERYNQYKKDYEDADCYTLLYSDKVLDTCTGKYRRML